jgi:anti-sigma regulatory factor (Ser/Thr protein kinase)
MAASARFFSVDDTSPACARRWVKRVLAGWRVSDRQQHDVLLVVSELATNAVIHAHSDFVVVVQRAAGSLGIAVADDSADDPTPREPSPERVGGRGMRIVQALARRWGVEPIPGDGKIVWATLAG